MEKEDTNECRSKVIELIEKSFKENECLSDSDVKDIKAEINDRFNNKYNLEIHTQDKLKNKNFDFSIDNGNWQKYYYDPQTEKAFTRRSNKSSVTRIIISNYNDKEIKELKVLYKKQGGVDTIYIEKMELDGAKEKDEAKGKIIFSIATGKPNSVNDINIKTDNGIILFEKKDNFTNKISRKFKIEGEYVKTKGYTLVKVNLEDQLDGNCNTEKRKVTAYTERRLIPTEQIKNYAFLLNKSDIDSLTIYKTKRFMTYRSNMEFYYNFIDKFFTYKSVVYKFNNLYEYNGLKEKNPNCYECCTNDFVDKIESKIQDYIRNDENRINNLKNKSINKDNVKIQGLEPIKYTREEIKEDIPKIIAVLTDIRHGLMHFNYKLFEELFTGTNTSLTENLNLNIFKKLSAIKDLKEESTNTYLEDNDRFFILNDTRVKAKDVYNFYYKICSRKNGLNKFINSFFITDGVENAVLKDVINQDFDENLKCLQESINQLKVEEKKYDKLENKLKELSDFKKKVGEAYAIDIHQCHEYKMLYNEHKNLVENQMLLISQPRNETTKGEITEINDKILDRKKKMEEITKINAKIRLEYKMRLFFGFLKIEFKAGNGIDFDDFMRNFNPSKKNLDKKEKTDNEKDMKDFISNEKGKEYLLIHHKKETLKDFKLKSAIKAGEGHIEEEDLFENAKENNLFKLYVLFYLLLPYELRGDFLGYAKEHYYGIKNVEFIPNKADDNKNQVSDEVDESDSIPDDIDNMDFFHKLRLFEKNIKKFEIISYSLTDNGEFKERIRGITSLIKREATKNNMYFEGIYKNKDDTVFLFDKNIVAPILKLYEKLYNLHTMVEIHVLTGIGISKGQTLDKVIEDATPGDYYNYSKLINNWRWLKGLNNDYNAFNSFMWARNNIAHLNYKNLFDEELFDLNNKKSSLGEIIFNSVKLIYKYNLDSCSDLGMNFVNDFYMSLDNFIFNTKKHSYNDITSGKKEELLEKDDEYLKSLGLENVNCKKFLEAFSKMKDFKISQLKSKNQLESYIKKVAVTLPTEINETNGKTVRKKTVKVWLPYPKDMKKYETNIDGAVHSAGSRLSDIYIKRMGLVVKDYLIRVLTKNEKRLLNLYVVDKSNEKVNSTLYMFFIERNNPKAIAVLPDQGYGRKLKLEWFSIESKGSKGKEGESTKKNFDTVVKYDGHVLKKFNFESSYIHRINYIIPKQDK